MKIVANYVSIWDDGIQLTSTCFIDSKTGLVEVLENHDVNVEVLDDEFIDLEDIRIEVEYSETNELMVKDLSALKVNAKALLYI